MQTYAEALNGIVPSPNRYITYMKRVFDGVPIKGSSVLDVGGGNGMISYYAAAAGASSVVCLDPLDAGSNEAMECQYESFVKRVGGPVSKIRERFQDLKPDHPYDVVLVHNAVNHLDEDACQRLPDDDAWQSYREIFRSLRSLVAPGGWLIMADCARRNLWGDIHLPNIFSPTIEWHIHQQPKMWDKLLVESGFQPGRIRWNALSKLHKPGQILLGNRVGAYLTNSHFILTSHV